MQHRVRLRQVDAGRELYQSCDMTNSNFRAMVCCAQLCSAWTSKARDTLYAGSMPPGLKSKQDKLIPPGLSPVVAYRMPNASNLVWGRLQLECGGLRPRNTGTCTRLHHYIHLPDSASLGLACYICESGETTSLLRLRLGTDAPWD